MQIIDDAEALIPHHGGTLVPTMGALHAGHLSLIQCAHDHHAPIVVSLFVNPTQFAPDEDFTRYPRPIDDDVRAAKDAGCDVLFAPPVEVVYPPDAAIQPPPLPSVATQPGLEDTHRPDHFAGVCQIVARLFDLTQPAAAVFGEKDYQQLCVIRAMVADHLDRWPFLRVVASPTIRESDGLAMSSRNQYLAADDRPRAAALHDALTGACTSASPSTAEETMRTTLLHAGFDVDYAVVRDADTLLPIDDFDRPARALIAAHLGSVRLIDNMAINGRP